MAPPLITVDTRMFRSSGIGTYLRALLPRIVELLPEARFCLLGRPAELSPEFPGEGRVAIRELLAGVYSPGEQIGLFRSAPADTSVFWSPHVNVPLRSPGRLLVTVHDAFYLAPPAGVPVRLDKRLYLGALMRVIRRRAERVLTVSEFSRGELLRVWPERGERIAVVPNGVDESWFEAPDGPRPQERPYFVYVGNLKEHKNISRTLAAYAVVAPRIEHDFLLCGLGDAERYRRDVPAELGSRVRFLGALDRDALKRHVAGASALVLASLYEGFGLPPLEAMALGVPVLVSRAASLPEVCGDAAEYCDPYSVGDIARGLEAVALDGELRARLVAAGRERARAFSWSRAAERTAAELCAVLG